MNPNRSQRRVHGPEFKAQVLAQCRQPGASIAGVAVAHGLNPNVVRKWLAGRGLKRMGIEGPVTKAPVTVAHVVSAPKAADRAAPTLQFVPVELTRSSHAMTGTMVTPPLVRIEIEREGLQLKLRCGADTAPTYAALLRALADAVLADAGVAA